MELCILMMCFLLCMRWFHGFTWVSGEVRLWAGNCRSDFATLQVMPLATNKQPQRSSGNTGITSIIRSVCWNRFSTGTSSPFPFPGTQSKPMKPCLSCLDHLMLSLQLLLGLVESLKLHRELIENH